MNGVLRKLLLRDVPSIEGHDGVNQSDRERRAGTQARTRRQVAVVMDLESLVAFHPAKHGARGRVLDFGDLADILDL